jgi:hypothetical protein
MVLVLGPDAWGMDPLPWKVLPDGTLVIVLDPTRGGGGPDGPIRCYKAGRVREGKVSEWRDV